MSINVDFQQLSEADAGKTFQKALTQAMIESGVIPNSSIDYSYKKPIFSGKIKIEGKITLLPVKIQPITNQLHLYSEKSQFRKVVEILADAASRLMTQCYISPAYQVKSTDIHKIHDAFTRDYPNFWFVYGLSCRAHDYVFQVIFSFNQLPEQSILQYDKQIQQDTQDVVKQCLKFAPAVQKVYLIQSFISQKTKYNLSPADKFQQDNIRNLIGVFVTQQCVCAGMAYAFKTLCDYLQIPAIVVYGYGGKTENAQEAHAWNMCCIENEWYFFDPTWNHDEHPYGEWFNVTKQRIENDHFEDDTEILPLANNYKMNLFEVQKQRIADRQDNMSAEEQIIKIMQTKLQEKRLSIGILEDQQEKLDLTGKFFNYFNAAKYKAKVNCQAKTVKFRGEVVYFNVEYSDERVIFEFPTADNAEKNVKYFVNLSEEQAVEKIKELEKFGYSVSGDEQFTEFTLM